MVRGNGKVKFAEVRGVGGGGGGVGGGGRGGVGGGGGGGGVRGGGGHFLEEVILSCLSREYLHEVWAGGTGQS